MKRVLKWAGAGLLVIALLIAGGAIYVWVISQRLIDEVYEAPESTFVYDASAADLDEAWRTAIISGCFDGCHGKGANGQVFNDDLTFGVFNAPNLTQAFAEMSDVELDSTIRHGVRRDGTSNLMMPSASFHHMTDEAFNNLVAFIRSLSRTEGPRHDVRPGILARYIIMDGLWVPQAKRIRDDAPWIEKGELPPRLENGKYLALTVCGECHGMDHNGFEGFTPGLGASLAYSEDDFRRLLREGIPIGNRELGLMAEVAVNRFSMLTDDEVNNLRLYLHAYFRNEI